MSFFLPFNFRPAGGVNFWEDADGEQTVAVGTYSLVTVAVQSGGTFLINGDTVLSTNDNNATGNGIDNGTVFTMTSGRSGTVTGAGTNLVFAPGAGTPTINLGTSIGSFTMVGGDTLVNSASTAYGYSVRYTDPTGDVARSQFWLDTGDTFEVNGTGSVVEQVFPVT